MWIARDKNGSLWLYNEKPIKFRDGTWKGQTEFVRTSKMSEDLFPEVKWEDKEPRELVLKPIKEE